MTLQRRCLILCLAALLLGAGSARAEKFTTRLPGPATVKGFVGGEAHDSYSIHLRKGQILTVQISWQQEHDKELGDNNAQFFVTASPDFGGDTTAFGNESDSGRKWSGKIPRSGNYYIYVIGHPSVHYTLKVSAK
jgi:hypothetical protein